MAILLVVLASASEAGPFVADPSYGRWVLTVNDGTHYVASVGPIGVDAEGHLSLAAPVRRTGTGWQATISGVHGLADPSLGFAIVAMNIGNGPVSFLFSFTIPVALPGTIAGHSALTYGLSTTADQAVALTPTRANILTAFERDSTPGGLGDLNKGLDIGSGSSLTGPGHLTVGPFVGTNVFTGHPAYDLMVVDVGFALTPGATATMAGFVEQYSPSQPVPEPGSLLLIGYALCAGTRSACRRGARRERGAPGVRA